MSNIYAPRPKFGRPGRPVQEGKCRAQVFEPTFREFHQCNRKASVERDGLGFCHQHDPEAERARAGARRERLEAQNRAFSPAFDQAKAYRDALRQIALGHNDPRALAAEVLKWWESASAGEAGTAETTKIGSVHEHAVPKADARH